MKRTDAYLHRARALALEAGVDPDSRTDSPNGQSMPAWCAFIDKAKREEADLARDAMQASALIPAQAKPYQNSPLHIFGDHEESTISQMRTCLTIGNTVAGVICADGHLGYAQPVGGVIAYQDQVSISGVGFDIGCGNLAARLDLKSSDIKQRLPKILERVRRTISFGVGRVNAERVEHELLDDSDSWRLSGMSDYRDKAAGQLGTVGSGNHYVDVFEDENEDVWIGVHFGSRGLGHTTATRYLKAAGGKDGINVPPTVVPDNREIGQRYLAAMELAGRYAYAGREWVVEKVRQIIGGSIVESVHNNHNYAWRESHGGKDVWVVRKGATPAFPGQRGFVGGSMGDDAVILEGVESEKSKDALYSTVHGAGRLFGRREAKRRFTHEEMRNWLDERGVLVSGGDLDESPMAYRRLPDVLAHHAGTVKVVHTLRPVLVAMAGNTEDPWKD